ncbi:hypothetical protein HYW68_01120 [Candidatus Parcubacteria bacterium]|nr:hypothetical protein [Candidatus Parcubacteria bacterium]
MAKNGKNGRERTRLDLHPETRRSIWVISAGVAAIVVGLSYAGFAGKVGSLVAGGFFALFGRGYVLVPVALAGVSLTLFRSKRIAVGRALWLGGGFTVLGLFGLLGLAGQVWGGLLGSWIAGPVAALLGAIASAVVFLALTAIGVLVISNKSLLGFRRALEIHAPQAGDAQAQPSMMRRLFPTPSFTVREIGRETAASKPAAAAEAAPSQAPAEIDLKEGRVMAAPVLKNYTLPPTDLLELESGRPSAGDIKANAAIIKRTLENFGIEVEMGEVNVGPTVTQYTLKPAQGIKLSRISALQNDLALALAAHPLRLEAPIPGRSLVGLEIPNRLVSIVRLRNLIENPAFPEGASPLKFALGRDVSGMPVYDVLSRMPHLLIAGSTGSGKSVCIHAVLTSFLFRSPPHLLRFILVDPKRVELNQYKGIPHLLTPVITEPKKAIGALRWAISEMERRYGLLEDAGARDIRSYNLKVAGRKEGEVDILPYLVIVIDELADIMAAYGRELEGAVVRLAQMARAVGIHLIIATQRPSIDVITGLIKANITSRIAFQVASQVDSRTILDMAGAEKLLGNGDMLFMSGDASKPRRIQGAFISEKEVHRVVEYVYKASEKIAELPTPEAQEVFAPRSSADGAVLGGGEGDVGDALYEEAKKLVVQAGKASASLLQRRLRVGYARAARLLDIMEERGVVGPADGAKPREVMMRKDEA